ncbi:MAG TPA: hypothetical protein VG500_13435 [Gemmatimonadales bacterium]|jgi:hypothetical protein|nr:hypothetical protein [Gemmatimonadales bacterium]
MDKQALALLIPIVAMLIPIAGIVFHGMQKVARLRLEEARVRAGELDGATAGEVVALREEIGEVRRELAEVQERLDFAERLLTKGRAVE